jgi:putative DNA primase/helicase
MKDNNLEKIFPLTDTGNAERLVDGYGTDFRFCKGTGDLVYNDMYWVPDAKNEIAHYAKQTVLAIPEEAKGQPEAQQHAIQKHANSSQSLRAQEAMVKLARSEPEVVVKPDELDQDPWLFNVINGTLELENGGRLRKHRRADLITKISPVSFDQNAICPRWDLFLEQVQPDHETRAFLQRLVGYAMTGTIREHILPINFGTGRNGKSVFVDTILHVMGSYAKQVPAELLIASRFDRHPTEKALLLGCRFAAASETEQGRELNIALVKQLTGGDRISARLMRQDYFEFEPTHKLMLSTNNRPVIRETTAAIWERVLLIPWDVTISKEDQDPCLKDKLKEEFSGILRWMVDGCVAWQEQGLNPPESVLATTQEYRREENNVATFIDERCQRNATAKVGTNELFAAYQEWCSSQGEIPLPASGFRDAVTGLGIHRGKSSIQVYRGVELSVAGKPALERSPDYPRAA